jgi:HEAT repeat protein
LAGDQVFWLGGLTAVVCIVVVLGIRRQYAASVLRTLREGLAEQVLEGGPGLAVLTSDPAVTAALVDALADPEPGVRRMAAGLLGRTSVEGAGTALIRAVDDDPDPAVRAAALEALTTLGGPPPAAAAAEACLLDLDARVREAAVRALGAVSPDPTTIGGIPTIADLVHDPDPGVRAAIACLFGSRGPEPSSERIIGALLDGPDEAERIAGLDAVGRLGDAVPIGWVRPHLADPSPEVRAATVDALAASSDAAAVLPDLLAALDDESEAVRRTAALALSRRETTPPGLTDLLATGSPRAQEAALTALRGHGPDVREIVIDWTLGRLARAADLRRARSALSVGTAGSTERQPRAALDFLVDVLAGRERRAVRLGLDALVVLGAPEAGGVIRRCLHSDDVEVRAQAIEALDSIGDRRLSGALIGLIEDDSAGGQDRVTALARLADDEDHWIRRAAGRVSTEGSDMPDTTRTLGDLDTMLFLRRVPLFEGLDPEDLQRVALTAIEHVYPPGEAIVREGDVGDELVVIVEGTVRVVHVEPDGSERLIRRYESGDHIGELAVLREAPRAATVIAEGDGVRGLVIGGQGLKSILHERPDAAMAMLATLAERISRQ